jgi:hypothetical protein
VSDDGAAVEMADVDAKLTLLLRAKLMVAL